MELLGASFISTSWRNMNGLMSRWYGFFPLLFCVLSLLRREWLVSNIVMRIGFGALVIEPGFWAHLRRFFPILVTLFSCLMA